MPVELKPCPFCGSNAEMEHVERSDASGWYVQCTNRACRANCNMLDESDTGIARAWNQRADIKEENGSSHSESAPVLCPRCESKYRWISVDGTVYMCAECNTQWAA